jgi:hypothetical protein
VTSDQIASLLMSIWGAALAIGLEWFPKVSGWWTALEEGTKRLYMLGFLLGSGVIYFALGCFDLLYLFGTEPVSCTTEGAFIILKAVWWAAVSSQTVHLLSKRSKQLA